MIWSLQGKKAKRCQERMEGTEHVKRRNGSSREIE